MAILRGLVISCPITIVGNSLRIKSSDLDPQELRFSLLFWDKLDFPANDMIGFTSDENAEFLISAGILNRTRVQVLDGQLTQICAQAHVDTYRTLDEQEPGVWSLGAGENSISFPPADVEHDRGVLVRLYQAIPVPDKDVPLQDILEFREKRSAELLALRYHLEVIYQRIVGAGDGALALNTEIGSLEQAIADHISASKESKLSFRNMSFDAGLNVAAGVFAGLTVYNQSLDIVNSLLVGAGAAISVTIGRSLKRHTPTSTPFQYISSYHEKVF